MEECIKRLEDRLKLFEGKATAGTMAITEIVKEDHLINQFAKFLLEMPCSEWPSYFSVTERAAYRLKGNIRLGYWPKLPYYTAILLFTTYLRKEICRGSNR